MFRFTIRDLVWLTAVVAMGAAWCLEHWRLQAEVSRGVSSQLRDRARYQQKTEDLKMRIAKLEKTLIDAGVRVPQERPDMTIGELMDVLNTAEKGRGQK